MPSSKRSSPANTRSVSSCRRSGNSQRSLASAVLWSTPAYLELANQGFIRIIPRQGSIVADYKRNGTLQVLSALMNCDSFRLDYPLFCNLVDLRILIECECARLASRQAGADEISPRCACSRNPSKVRRIRLTRSNPW